MARAIWLKLAPVSLVVLISVALPQMFSIHAGAAPNPPAGILFFVNTLDDHDDGACNGTDCTLREAIRTANSNPGDDDGIEFSVTGTINLTSALPDITGGVSIEGPGASLLTVQRNSTNEFRIFNVTTIRTVSFSGLTISNGSDSDGGGIQNDGIGTVNVTNCTINGNFATSGLGGGGIENHSVGTVNVTNSTVSNNSVSPSTNGGAGIHQVDNGTVNVINSTISGNFAPGVIGGGILNEKRGTVSITNSTISDNVAGDGGGISAFGRGTVAITNSTISGNFATRGFGGGGGIATAFGIVNIINSTISNNSADQDVRGGGGILNETGTVNVTNSTISGNSVGPSTNGGAGIYQLDNGTVNVINSTISGNRAAYAIGGGIFNEAKGAVNVTNSTISDNVASCGGGIFAFGPGTVTIKSSIIALNTATDPDASGPFTSGGFNLIGKTDGSTGFTASTDLTGTIASPRDPGLDPNGLQDNGGLTLTIALLCDSAAIDKGTRFGLSGVLIIDQRGFPRTVDDPLFPNASGGDGTDIGAFELNTQDCNHPPVALCQNIQVSAGANCQATITPQQIDNGSYDPDKGDSIATRTLDNSGPFGLGSHTVTLTVTDTHGASSSCTATVTVVDTTPPTITCPPNKSVPAAPGQCQAVVNYSNPTVSDNCAGASLVGCVPPSGTTFQVGTTTVTCTAKDAANNTSSCSFTVTVNDTQPPTITCPANITSVTDQNACPNPACQIVTYPSPTVQDNCPGVTFMCNPPSGSCFPTGVTTVVCTANDTAGNTASCSFTVTTFDVALQDDSNSTNLLLWNSITGSYRFCCNGITFIGVGKVSTQGCVYTLEHNPADRRVLGRVDKSVHSGTASLQAPPGTLRCTITDRSTLNDSNLTACQ